MSRSGEAGVRVQGSHWWRFALKQVLIDVIGIPLEPGRVQENVLAALLHSTLGRWGVMSLKETLREHTNTHEFIAMLELRGIFCHRTSILYLNLTYLYFCSHFVNCKPINSKLDARDVQKKRFITVFNISVLLNYFIFNKRQQT